MQHLHPGARWLFRIGAYFFFLFLAIFSSVFFGFVVLAFLGGYGILILILFIISFTIICGEIYARLAYKYWKYEFTPTNLKIERGIIWKKYSNIPYERVQNVDIQRGIIARLFGFSSVNIQTAGYSYSSRGIPRSEGYLPAVSVEGAEKIREFLMEKISKRGGGGQGL